MNLLPTPRSFINVISKAILLPTVFFVGYIYGLNNNHLEITKNQQKIQWLEEKTVSQQQEIDLLKIHALEASSIKTTIDNLSNRISELEVLIKTKGIK